MPIALTPKFIFIDDQLAPGQESTILRCRNALTLPQVEVIYAYTWTQVRQAIEDQHHRICGFIVDLHLLTLQPTDNFREFGLATFPYDAYWAGGQFVKIMTHPDYANHRKRWANGALSRYENAPFLILSSNQYPEDAIEKWELDPKTPKLWKDDADGVVESRLREWTSEQLKLTANARGTP